MAGGAMVIHNLLLVQCQFIDAGNCKYSLLYY